MKAVYKRVFSNISEIYSATKGIISIYDIIIVLSRHVEVIAKLERHLS